MARRRRPAAHVNHERWLISYADFITLLLALFVVMFASSQPDKKKAQQISHSVTEALESGGGPTIVYEIVGGSLDRRNKGNSSRTPAAVSELTPAMKYLDEALAAEIKAGKIEVHLDVRGLVISLRQEAFFPSGADEIALSELNSIEKISTIIRNLRNPVQLEGHTDSVPIHNQRFRNNWELSAARSIAMLQVLTGPYGIPEDRFAVAGYAETRPVDTNDSIGGRSHNRRVDIVILNARL
jgi:chemotaxis protein MotB